MRGVTRPADGLSPSRAPALNHYATGLLTLTKRKARTKTHPVPPPEREPRKGGAVHSLLSGYQGGSSGRRDRSLLSLSSLGWRVGSIRAEWDRRNLPWKQRGCEGFQIIHSFDLQMSPYYVPGPLGNTQRALPKGEASGGGYGKEKGKAGRADGGRCFVGVAGTRPKGWGALRIAGRNIQASMSQQERGVGGGRGGGWARGSRASGSGAEVREEEAAQEAGGQALMKVTGTFQEDLGLPMLAVQCKIDLEGPAVLWRG